MELQRMVQRHALLTVGLQRDKAARRQSPPKIYAELQRIETRAQAMLSPQELAQAQQASVTIQAQIAQQADVGAAMSDARDRGYYGERLAKEATGLTVDQLEHARRGEKFAVKGKGKNIKAMRHRIEGIVKSLGKQDMGYKQFMEVTARVEELKSHGKDPQPYLTKTFGKEKAPEASALIQGFEDSGIGLVMGLADARTQEKDHYVEPDEDLQRRASIGHTWAMQAADDPGSMQAIATDIEPSYFEEENDSSQGDVARAYMQVERESQNEERLNYKPPTYEIEEDDDVQNYGT